MLIVLKPFSNKWPLLTISLISLRIFWIYEWGYFSQKLDIRGFNLSIRMRQFRLEFWQIWFFKVDSIGYDSSYGKTEFWHAPHSHQSFHLIHQIFPKAKMRSRFMISCQLSLNGLPFIFPPSLLYKFPPPSFQDKKSPSLLFSWVLVKLSSLVISWSSWDSRYWVRLTLPLLALFFLHP